MSTALALAFALAEFGAGANSTPPPPPPPVVAAPAAPAEAQPLQDGFQRYLGPVLFVNEFGTTYDTGWIERPSGKFVCVTGAPCEQDRTYRGAQDSSHNWMTGEDQ